MHRQEWILKRNCSLSPRQLALAYAILCCASLAVALPFTLRGAWHISLFAALELACVGCAFLHYARHAGDHEHVALQDGCLLVELVEADRCRQFRLDPYWTRIALPGPQERLVVLEARGMRVRVGRFVTETKRRQFAQELRQELQRVPVNRSRKTANVLPPCGPPRTAMRVAPPACRRRIPAAGRSSGWHRHRQQGFARHG